MNIIDTIEKEGMKTNLPVLAVGDEVEVFVKIIEGTRERLQGYKGDIIAIKNGSIRETITVRHMSGNVGVERTFPIHSPKIDHIVVIKHGQVRRAKLYYLRERTGKAAKIKGTK
ncbi:MAG: 50S ribosomal protein L19 [Clostridia bacterium]